jgi:hypothetical protein
MVEANVREISQVDGVQITDYAVYDPLPAATEPCTSGRINLMPALRHTTGTKLDPATDPA